jgi:alpha-N-arabinofuranosidase
MRDALVAAITLDTFNRHADKIAMANIAQLVNVLQALILTDGSRMMLTPTYQVFVLYLRQIGASAVRMEVEHNTDATFAVKDHRRTMPTLSGSASLSGKKLTVSLVNAHATLPADVELNISLDTSQMLTLVHEDITAHNTFDQPAVVMPRKSQVSGSRITLPAASVTVLSDSILR